MSNQVALHNTHKSYDSIITPLDDSELLNNSAIKNSPTPQQQPKQQIQSQSVDDFTSDNTDSRLLKRTNSLDSLVNSEQNSSIDEISDSDSLCELKRLSSLESKIADLPRKIVVIKKQTKSKIIQLVKNYRFEIIIIFCHLLQL
jgi:hypothetical protein